MPVHRTKSIQAFDEHRRFIRQEVAAERWDVSVDTIRRLIASGKITGYRLNGRMGMTV